MVGGGCSGSRLRWRVTAVLRALWYQRALSICTAARAASSRARTTSSSVKGSGLRVRLRSSAPSTSPRAMSGTAR